MEALPKLSFFSKLLFLLSFFSLSSPLSSSTSSLLHPSIADSAKLHRNYTAISDFRLLNRRKLLNCPRIINPSVKLTIVSASESLLNEEFINVTVSGVSIPSIEHWVAMITPSNSNVDSCPLNEGLYLQTGDLSSLPLLCHYPVKAAYLRSDPDYLRCKKSECRVRSGGRCLQKTCNATLSFHVINFRTDVEFALFGGGFATPCLLLRSQPRTFQNPNAPLYGLLSATDSTGTSMRLSWVSGDKNPQQLKYGQHGTTQTSHVSSFSQNDMCNTPSIQSPAKDFGWHDPGFIHSAVMTQLQPSTTFSYKFGSDQVGWSDEATFTTPPAGGDEKDFHFLAFGDMGKAPLDSSSVEHYIQPGSISVVNGMTEEVESGKVDAVFHIGDISYATGFLVEWDFFLHLIKPIASRVPYMTAIGNHERDYDQSGSVYRLPDSGGECGVPYETYFQMPTFGKDQPWYSIEMASVHFTVVSTEHPFTPGSPQYEWMKKDMASVNRSRTPWLVFTGHRPMYSSIREFIPSVDPNFVAAVEPLLLQNKVDLVLFGHVHNYERTCSVFNNVCRGMPFKDTNGIDTYDHNNYTAPVHAVIGMAGFSLDEFHTFAERWSLARVAKFGYLRGHATKEKLSLEMVNAVTRAVEDSFSIIKAPIQ
ncbi:probable inactive purple acid phosphatase 27 [Cucurbita pepo subsp. pepo]|uniref:probable inactive purple acid phosphatase 27 n=1 Tax=Cucurbita pepo subsp. pepo TaxID=3664 RepID=UPI000C9D6538|nr:probable inactive purple acid phosphatase 27 [Cucurbita pepo subsp. pepo]